MQSTHSTTWRAIVALRSPRDGPDDLASCARRRLEARAGVDAATVTSVRRIEPALAATVVTVEATVDTTSDADAAAIEAYLEAAPGSQRVDSVERA